MKQKILILLCCISTCIADNGHLLTSYKTEEYNVAIFIEPWPARVGEVQLRALVTTNDGAFVTDSAVLPFRGKIETMHFDQEEECVYNYTLNGIAQPPLEFEIHPKANVLFLYWKIWLFLLLGLIFIILREKLAKNLSQRYPTR
jgi:hypothetical protein